MGAIFIRSNHELKKSIQVVKNGGILLYPTDTIWGLGCDCFNKKAVDRIFEIKNRVRGKGFILLVEHIDRLNELVTKIPEKAFPIIDQTTCPTSVIYKNPKNIPDYLISENDTICIRLTNHAFCVDLIKAIDKPLISTSANLSNKPSPRKFSEIDTSVLKAVDYVVNLQEIDYCGKKPSRIITFSDSGEPVEIRN